MAKVRLAAVIERIGGKVGREAMLRWQHGRQTLCKVPDMSNVKWSEAQKAHRLKFREAVGYARSAMADPRVSAKYEEDAARKGMRPFDLAVSDYFKGRDLFKSA
jgi:hypothetical protein